MKSIIWNKIYVSKHPLHELVKNIRCSSIILVFFWHDTYFILFFVSAKIASSDPARRIGLCPLLLCFYCRLANSIINDYLFFCNECLCFQKKKKNFALHISLNEVQNKRPAVSVSSTVALLNFSIIIFINIGHIFYFHNYIYYWYARNK